MQVTHSTTNGNHEVRTVLATLLVGCRCVSVLSVSCNSILFDVERQISMDANITCPWFCVQLETGQGNNQNTTQKQYNARYPQPFDESDSDSNLY